MADECPKCPPPGAPLWLATFADLMSLLMCFFVLLLSFATMDANKFRKLADSMENAFGVQKDIVATEVPMGTSIIAQHFSPAQTTPTPLEEIKQSTNQRTNQLDVTLEDMEQVKQKVLQAKLQEVEEQAQKIEGSLVKEIDEGEVVVETDGLNIIIRINEKASFASGSATVKPGFEPVMAKITEAVNDSTGVVNVAGHTDNVPISNDWFRSNWELAASRAVSVAHYLLSNKNTDSKRVVVQGYADTQPLADNDTPENRARNRRVEIIISQQDPTLGLGLEEIKTMIQTDTETPVENSVIQP